MFEIGDKVIWTIGSREITCRGIYIEEVDEDYSKIQCVEQNGRSAVVKLQVLTSLLKKDD